jgi:DNA-binding CsgD family transcriptional regulator
MNVFDTEMHLVTFLFVIAESILLLFQTFYLLSRPSEKRRLYFVILLLLLIFYNVTGGLFPDPALRINIKAQNILAYGTGFLMACYFPYYFYKAWELKELRFHAYFGVWLFLFLPYLAFIGIEYMFTGNLTSSVQHGVAIPFIYAIIVMKKMFKVISTKYALDNSGWTADVYLTYFAIIPWIALPLVSFFQLSQFIEVMFSNLGFIIITFLFSRNNIIKLWEEERQLASLNGNLSPLDSSSDVFLNNCQYYNLTAREIEIVTLIRIGQTYKSVATDLFIAEKTVAKHIQNVYRKLDVSNKMEMVSKLEDSKPKRDI